MYNNKNNQRYQKPTPVIATQEFETFEDAIDCMRESSTIVDDFFQDIRITDDVPEYDTYLAYIAKKIAEQYPALIQKHNIHTNYSISANRVSIRGERGLSFGWKVMYKVEEGVARITSVKSIMTLYKPFGNLKADLESKGWTLREKKKYTTDSEGEPDSLPENK